MLAYKGLNLLRGKDGLLPGYMKPYCMRCKQICIQYVQWRVNCKCSCFLYECLTYSKTVPHYPLIMFTFIVALKCLTCYLFQLKLILLVCICGKLKLEDLFFSVRFSCSCCYFVFQCLFFTKMLPDESLLIALSCNKLLLVIKSCTKFISVYRKTRT